MADNIMTNSATQAGAPFFSLNAIYSAAPGTAADALFNDSECLLASAIGVLIELSGSVDHHALHGAIYLLQQAQATQNAALSMIPAKVLHNA